MECSMGTTYSIFAYPKKEDNFVYATEYGMLPNRYEDLFDIYCNGKGDYPLGDVFAQLLFKKSGKSSYSELVMQFVKIESADRSFIVNALNELDDKEFEHSYDSRQYYIDLMNELFDKIDSYPEHDYYFKWG